MNRKTREGFYTLWTMAILLCLAVCVFVLAYVSIKGGGETAAQPAEPVQEGVPTDGSAEQTAEQPADQQAAADQQLALPGEGMTGAEGADMAQSTDVPAPTAPASVTLAETADAGQEYQDKLVFLGDSTTYGFRAYNVLPSYQVWVPASGTLSLFNVPTETIEYFAPGTTANPQTLSIADCAATGQPEYLVITLGINGVAILDETQFKGYYRDLIASIQSASPNTKIICQSVYPVIDSMAPSGINNAAVNAANSWILSLAEEMGVRYLNTHDSLLDSSTGELIASYNSGDGIHLTPDGLYAILQYVRTHAWQ